MQRDGFRCTCCGDEHTALAIHHLSYKGEPWEAPNDQLKTVCSHCHSILHELYDETVIKVLKYPPDEAGFFMIHAYCTDKVALMYYPEGKGVGLTTKISFNSIARIYSLMPEKFK